MFAIRKNRDVWREFESLSSDMDHWIRGSGRSLARSFSAEPAVDIWQNDDGVIVTAELPGVSPEDVEVTIDGDVLTICGNWLNDSGGDEGAFHRRERSAGTFSRSVRLPWTANTSGAEARYENGLLKLTLERPAETKPRKLTVKSS